MNTEIWKEIEGTDGRYSVSTRGRMHNNKRNRAVNPYVDVKKYLRIGYYVNGRIVTKFLHRVVAEAFIPNPHNRTTINHIDGDKANNCVENLEWVTQKENMHHAWRLGLKKIETNSGAKLTAEKVAEIRHLRKDGASIKDLSERFNISTPQIYCIVGNRSWLEPLKKEYKWKIKKRQK